MSRFKVTINSEDEQTIEKIKEIIRKEGKSHIIRKPEDKHVKHVNLHFIPKGKSQNASASAYPRLSGNPPVVSPLSFAVPPKIRN